MEVDQFAVGDVDVPLTSGCVSVTARVIHRGSHAYCAIQDLWTYTARCYAVKTNKKFFVPNLVFE